MKKNIHSAPKTRVTSPPRTSVTFPPGLYKALEELARKKKVSLAWIVREAAERYISAESHFSASSASGRAR
jgi:predicted DNA-binding protein